MNKSFEKGFFIFLVLLAHLGGLVGLLWIPTPKSQELSLPTLQGILLPIPPAETVHIPSAKPKPEIPEPEKKRLPKPPKEKSENAIKKVGDLAEVTQAKQTPTKQTPAIVSEPNNNAGAPVTPPRMDANPLNNPAPAYPKLSRRLGEQGTVVLEILILPDGSVGDVRLKESSGFARLDKTAIKAIKKWRYVPARRGDKAIEYWYLQPLEFTLK